ncbi:MAG TPA: hypothetical protein VGS22_17040 [Thermoanaerobaculia bacterium]|jgi:hypothetical protein|nr:hypothetical protein [Thermoanaerobaculia bacterium]
MPSAEIVEAPPLPPPAAGLESAVADAERYGRLEAEAFDAGLREIERRERENLLSRTALVDGGFGVLLQEDAAPLTGTEVLRLRREIDRLSDFHRALLHSRSWRLLQALKRPLGRAW